MNLPELGASVALIEADAARRFGADREAPLRVVFAREAALDRWLTGSGLTVSLADRVLRQVRLALGQRASAPSEEETMDNRSFDTLTRQAAADLLRRRSFLKLGAAGLAAVVAGPITADAKKQAVIGESDS